MRRTAALAVLLICAGSIAAQSLPRAAPEAVGMSSRRLARFDALAPAYVREENLAGAVTPVVRRGRVVHEGVYGKMDITTKKPMRRDAIFRSASMTKPITSVAVMMLVEEDKVLLSDPVVRYIPAFEHTTVAVQDGEATRIVPARRPITIEDLLTHTSGIPYPPTGGVLGGQVP